MVGAGLDNNTTQISRTNFNYNGCDPCIWSSPEGGCKIPIGKQIFCSRSLNMKNIVAVGFDMDYTLAQYKSETFETLAYKGTIRKLVDDLRYPPEVSQQLHSYDTFYVYSLKRKTSIGEVILYEAHQFILMSNRCIILASHKFLREPNLFLWQTYVWYLNETVSIFLPIWSSYILFFLIGLVRVSISFRWYWFLSTYYILLPSEASTVFAKWLIHLLFV